MISYQLKVQSLVHRSEISTSRNTKLKKILPLRSKTHDLCVFGCGLALPYARRLVLTVCLHLLHCIPLFICNITLLCSCLFHACGPRYKTCHIPSLTVFKRFTSNTIKSIPCIRRIQLHFLTPPFLGNLFIYNRDSKPAM